MHTTRENVNLIQEIIRQAFLLPLAPKSSETRRRDENAIEIVIRTFNWILWDAQMPIWCEEPKRDGSPEDIVRAGTQPALHCFILYSSNVFLTPKDAQLSEEILESQESICLKVLNMYRHVIMKVDMNDITWNQLLIVLVHISKHILNSRQVMNFVSNLHYIYFGAPIVISALQFYFGAPIVISALQFYFGGPSFTAAPLFLFRLYYF